MSVDSKVILIYSCKIVQYSLFRKLVLLSLNYREKCQNEYNFAIYNTGTIICQWLSFNLKAYFWMLVYHVVWFKTFSSSQHRKLNPEKQRLSSLCAWWGTRGNLRSQLLDFMRKLPQHFACHVLCQAKNLSTQPNVSS